jgi:hypothetical protein
MTTPTTTRTRQTGQHQFSRSGIGNAFRHSQVGLGECVCRVAVVIVVAAAAAVAAALR